MHIRAATSLDRDAIRRVHLSAFPEEESGLVAELAASLLSEKTTPEVLSLVAESSAAGSSEAQPEGFVVGHIAFSPVTIENDINSRGYILAPLGVTAEHQKRGIGVKLIEHGMEQLRKMGIGILFVYGDPQFYGRFGFRAEAAEPFVPAYELQYPFGWQAVVLNPGGLESKSGQVVCVDSLNNPTLW